MVDALGPKARDELIDLMCRKESAVYMQACIYMLLCCSTVHTTSWGLGRSMPDHC